MLKTGTSIRCLVNRFRISLNQDSETPLPKAVKRHLRQCSSCRDFYAFCDSLPDRLGAVGPDRPAWEGPIPVKRWRRRLAASACVAVILLGTWLTWIRPDWERSFEEEAVVRAEAMADLGRKIVKRCLPQEGESPLIEPWVDPIAVEVNRLAGDMKSMKGFLVALLSLPRHAGGME